MHILRLTLHQACAVCALKPGNRLKYFATDWRVIHSIWSLFPVSSTYNNSHIPHRLLDSSAGYHSRHFPGSAQRSHVPQTDHRCPERHDLFLCKAPSFAHNCTRAPRSKLPVPCEDFASLRICIKEAIGNEAIWIWVDGRVSLGHRVWR